ncbi:MAG: 14.7 kDa ribonuclease H-like protein [Syntrophomonadaceae bacterium]|nr:14.7 kDa ribonuclease H-like protein [Bacillota bacterium]
MAQGNSFFKKEGRYYPVGGLLGLNLDGSEPTAPSVTTIINVKSKPFLIPWVKKEAREEIISVLLDSEAKKALFEAQGREDIEKIIKHCLDSHQRKLQLAIDEGSFFHNAVESFYKAWHDGNPLNITAKDEAKYTEFIFDNYSDIYPNIRSMLTLFFGKLRSEGYEVVLSEHVVANDVDGMLYAGTEDAILRRKSDGKYGVGDWKTSTSLSFDAYMQTEAYRRAGNRNMSPDDPEFRHFRVLFRVDKEFIGDYDFKVINDSNVHDRDWKGFLSCLSLFYSDKAFEIGEKELLKRNREIYDRRRKLAEETRKIADGVRNPQQGLFIADATLFCDGACKGNPGDGGIGVLMVLKNGKRYTVSESIGKATNNIAEYNSLLRGLKEAQGKGARTLNVFMDSELVVAQLNGSYKVKNMKLKKLNLQIRELLGKFATVRINHIPREQNKEADALASKGALKAAFRATEDAELIEIEPSKQRDTLFR